MFAIPGALALVILVFIRPQAFIPQLVGVPLVHVCYLAAFLGFALDLRLRIIRPQLSPLLGWASAFFGWCLCTVALKDSSNFGTAIGSLFFPYSLFVITSHCVQTFRGFKTFVVLMLSIAMFLSVVGIHQRHAPMGCLQFKSSPTGVPDGRSCTEKIDCLADPDPGSNYACEHLGLFGTNAIGGRVRWLGMIQDPNELSMCISICLPLLIGLYLTRPRMGRGLFLLACGLAIALCVVYTQSRGGQVVFLVAIGVYFVRRYGVAGAMICLVAAVPVLLLGGRSGEEADQSKMERIEALYIAMNLLSQYPLTGVGWNQFTEYNELTAHNSYALSAAELGLPGLFLFVALLYLTMKSFVMATRRYSPDGPSRVAYVWAGALIAALTGFMVGIFLLSFNTHPVLWAFLGLCSGFNLAVEGHDPTFRARLGWRDLLNVGALTTAIASFMFVYSRWKMAGH